MGIGFPVASFAYTFCLPSSSFVIQEFSPMCSSPLLSFFMRLFPLTEIPLLFIEVDPLSPKVIDPSLF
tara:strand:- start:841 stop:1044 length:204 start_codon:yes stop_codon:yes gene_type:complete